MSLRNLTDGQLENYKRTKPPKGYKFVGDHLVSLEDERFLVTQENKPQIIDAALRDPKTAGGRDRLYGHLSEVYSNISRRDVAAFLAKDESHQVMRPQNKRLTVRPIMVKGPAMVAQIDLIDMQKIAGHNEQKRYVLTYVDLYSRFVNARAIPNKTQSTVTAALLRILDAMPEDWRPRTIQADNGSEFASVMEAALKSRGIKMIHSQPHQPRSQGAIERFNFTLKSAIFKYFTRVKTKNYTDVLPDFLENFNNTRHSSTGYRPISIMEGEYNPAVILEKQHKKLEQIKEHDEEFDIGELVRVALTTESAARRNKFAKKINQNWSTQVYEIYSKSEPETAGTQEQYLLINLATGRASKKKYWAYQLQHAEEPNEQEPEPEPEPELELERPAAAAAPAQIRRSARPSQLSEAGYRHFAQRQ